jgi:hypothetical protein
MPSYIYQFCEVRMKTKVFGNADVGCYTGNENGLTVAGTDGFHHCWSGSGKYTREWIPTAADNHAAYLREVPKSYLYERMEEMFQESFGYRIDIDNFREKVAELRLHAGELTAEQWAWIERTDVVIERNHDEFELERAEEWLKTQTFSSYCHELTYLLPRGLATALRWLYGPMGSERRSLYETGGVEAVYEHDRIEKLATVARYRAMLENAA